MQAAKTQTKKAKATGPGWQIHRSTGQFTSSDIGALMSKAKKAGEKSAKAQTYISETNMERRLGRPLQTEVHSRAISWGALVKNRVLQLLGKSYKATSDKIIHHPKIDYWCGNADATHLTEPVAVCDIKCPVTLKSFCQWVDALDTDEPVAYFRRNHPDGENAYWQLVSNAILTGAQFAELIIYCPYQKESSKEKYRRRKSKKQSTVLLNFKENEDSLFTPVFWKVRSATRRYVVVYGGAASSKSYSVHQSELINLMQQPDTGSAVSPLSLGEGPGVRTAADGAQGVRTSGDTLIIRKHASDIRESCFKLFSTLIKQYNLGNYFRQVYSNDQRKITYLPTGHSLIFKGIDDPEQLKSITGIKRIVIEEANQLTFADFLELNRRARGIHGIQIIFILNPVSENHWIKTKLCTPGSPYYNDTDVFRFTYRDNTNAHGESFLTTADITELERLKQIDENQYRIYVLAEWGIDNKEGKFCWAFDRLTQAVPTTHDPELITWASFDFNLNPMSCTIAQILPEEKTVRAIRCIKLNNSDIWQMCAHLQTLYPGVPWLITGDATGQHSSAMVSDHLNYYKIIIAQLGISHTQVRIPTHNPRIEENRLLVNAIHKNWRVQIDPIHCQPLIYDLQYVEINREGHLLKDRTTESRKADFLDTWRYLINTAVRPYVQW